MRLSEDKALDLLGVQVNRYEAICTRQAAHSVQIKTWCVTAVAAVAAVTVETSEPSLLLVGAAVVLCLYFIDAYCMLLERHFRRQSEALVDTVFSSDKVDVRTLFVVEGPRGRPPKALELFEGCGVVRSGTVVRRAFRAPSVRVRHRPLRRLTRSVR